MNPLAAQIDYMGMWHISIFVGLCLCVLFPMRRFQWEVSFLWAYVLISALYILEFPSLPFAPYTLAFQATAGQTLAEVLIIPLFAILISDSTVVQIINAFKWIIMYEIMRVWIQKDGLLIAPSFDTALIALYLPFAGLWLKIASIATIATHHGSTALVIILAQLAALSLKERGYLKWLFAAIPALATAAYIHHHGPWLDGIERIDKWKKYMNVWLQNPRFIALGSGPGTFMWIGLLIDEFKPPLFLAMHNDWLQMLFEIGIIGTLLVIMVIRKTIINCWEDTRVLCAVFGCIAFAATYHPLRFFPSAFLIALIFRLALFMRRREAWEYVYSPDLI
jgi:hypothetical protein